MLLYNAVSETNAHIPTLNMTKKYIKEACAIFISCILLRMLNLNVKPKGKTVFCRFELISKQ